MKRLLLSLFLIGSSSLYPMVRKQAQVIKQADSSYLLTYESGRQVVLSPAQMNHILADLARDQRALFLAGNTGILAEYVDQNIHRFSSQSTSSAQSSSTNASERAASVVASERQASAALREKLMRKRVHSHKKETSSGTISEVELLDATRQKINEYLRNGDIQGVERYRDHLKSQSHGWAQQQVKIIETVLVRDDVQMLVAMHRASTSHAEELLHEVVDSSTDDNVLQGATAIVDKKKKPKPEIGALPWSGTNRLVDAPSTVVEHADMVSTPARAVPNISWDVDARIEATLKHLKQAEIAHAETHGKTPHFAEQMKAVGIVLDELKAKGLLKPNVDEVQEAIRHGIIHFLKEFDPTSIADNPGEFMVNVTQHIAVATFHIMTDGMFIGAQEGFALATQIYDLYQAITTDRADLSSNCRAELIAEQLAGIIKTFCADQITRRALGSRARGGAAGASNPSEVHDAVTADGRRIGSDELGMSLEVSSPGSQPSTANHDKFVKIKHPVLDCERVGSALKIDPYHGFDKLVDNFARFAK